VYVPPPAPPSAGPGRRIAIIGTGYVGLTAAACFAWLGHDVICSDASQERVARLRAGDVPIVEDGLPELVLAMVSAGRLSFTTDNRAAVTRAEFVFLCLPTPDGGDGRADLSFVLRVAAEIGPELVSGAIVVNKSTVPVGTARLVARQLARGDVEVVSNPEFLAEGTALRDFFEPDRVVVGGDSEAAAVAVAALYAGLTPRIVTTDVTSSELIKYASNAFLATKLTFVNSLAAICEAVGADVASVTAGMGSDRRIGREFLSPGPGWGGSCFPKDSRALIATAREFGAPFTLLEAAVAANVEHRMTILDKLARLLPGDLDGARIALWGLTFKAGTDDLRDSPALQLALALQARGARVRAFDPAVRPEIAGIEVVGSPIEACEGAALLLVATEWPEFSEVDLHAVAEVMAHPVALDVRNILDPRAAASAGIRYEGIGIRPVADRAVDRDAERMAS
jgi:UDPglucose 6-dehydrogenase